MQKLNEYLFVMLVLIVLALSCHNLYRRHFVGLSERTADNIARTAR